MRGIAIEGINGALRLDHLGLGRSWSRPKPLRSAQCRQLHSGKTDTARSAGDQHLVACSHA